MGWRAGISTYGLPSVGSYDDAKRAWERARVARGNLTRRYLKLKDTTKFIDYYTDNGGPPTYFMGFGRELVRYYATGRICVSEGYTAGDADFANHTLPGGVYANYKSYLGNTLRVYSRLYRLDGLLALELDGNGVYAVTEPSRPWKWPRLDAAHGRAALKEWEFQNFRHWTRATVHMDCLQAPRSLADMTTPMAMMRDRSSTGLTRVASALKNPDRWHEVVRTLMVDGKRGDNLIKAACDMARTAIHFASGALAVHEFDHIHENDASRYYRAVSKYHGLAG